MIDGGAPRAFELVCQARSCWTWQIGFYRTAAGAELDLVVESPAGRIGVEIKFSASPKPTKGFWQALHDLAIERAFVVALVLRRYPLAPGVEVVPVWDVERIVGRAAGQ